jgi:hypothetical protein
MRFDYEGYSAEVVPALSLEAADYEGQLLKAGIRLPFPHRTASAVLEPPPGPLFFLIRDPAGAPCGGFAAQRRRSQALPGHVLLRVERFGAAMPSAAVRTVAIRAFTDVCRATPRLLRAYVNLFAPDPAVQREIAASAAANGFRRNPNRRGYATTILVDLRPDEEQIFASLNKTARYNIRMAAKFPVAVRPVDDAQFAPRLDALVSDAFARTRGEAELEDWPALIRFSARHPELSQILGLFRTDGDGPASLLSFAQAVHHGEYAEYRAAASTRDPNVRVPQTHVLAWELMRWARQHGASFFDLGGVTPSTHTGPDPFHGISGFKRFFSKTEVTLGDEWVLEPSPLRAGLARVVTSVARSVASR